MDPPDGDLKVRAGQHHPASRQDPPTAAPTHADRPGTQAQDLTHQAGQQPASAGTNTLNRFRRRDLGHAEASTTLRQYCHAPPLHDEDVADQLSNLLDNA